MKLQPVKANSENNILIHLKNVLHQEYGAIFSDESYETMADELKKASAELAEYQSLAESFADSLKIESSHVIHLKKSISQLEELIDRLHSENEGLQNRIKDFNKYLMSARSLRLSIFSEIFYNIEFIHESIDIINDLPERGKIYEILLELNNSNDEQWRKAPKVQSLTSWRELHFSTGKSDDGRLYFAKKEEKVQTLVSLKRYQKQDILYLQSID